MVNTIEETKNKLELLSINSAMSNSIRYSMASLKEEFTKEYLSVANSGFGDENSLKDAEVVVIFGGRVADDSAALLSKIESKDTIYMHPIEDSRVDGRYIKYEAGSEEGVALLLLKYLSDSSTLTSSVAELIEDLDIGYLSAESSCSEEELDELKKIVSNKRVALVIGLDLATHDSRLEIARVVAAIANFSDIDIVPSYFVDAESSKKELTLSEPEELPSYDGVVVYNIESDSNILSGSKQFAQAAKLQDGVSVEFEVGGIKCNRLFKIDESLKGTIALNPMVGIEKFYRFNRVNIKIGSENG